ncbi:MAG: aspartyl protease family protein [Bacteroidota bacterium]|nr:aspartyl protease family protein [Bacteroidota bacterium]
MHKRLLLHILCWLLTCSFVQAQEEFITPQAKPLTRFPFTMLSGGIVIVRGRLDNIVDTLNFILDTGSGGISLDSATVDEFKMARIKSEKTIRGIAGMKVVDFTNNHTLHLPGLSVDSMDFHINDYGLLSSVYGVKIDGIIGFSLLRKFIVKVNYDSFYIEMLKPGGIRYPKGGHLLRPMFTTLAYQNATIADERAVHSKFIFDTGAGLCFLLSQDFVDDSSFLKKKRKFFATQTEGLGGKKQMNITVTKEVVIGPYHFKKVPVYVFDDDYNVTSYPLLGGIIGNDLLRRFNLILNYPEQRIYIHPNKHFTDPFDYSYTGLGFYVVDGNVTVVDVMHGSPAEKAGFKEDDVIVAIDNTFTNNIQLLKNLLQNAGAKVKVLVLREGKPVVINLAIQNILRK